MPNNESEVKTMNLLEELFKYLNEEKSMLLESEKQDKMYNDFTENFLDEDGDNERAFRSLYYEATKNAFIAGFNVAKQLIK